MEHDGNVQFQLSAMGYAPDAPGAEHQRFLLSESVAVRMGAPGGGVDLGKGGR